jgi:hypothetical protein
MAVADVAKPARPTRRHAVIAVIALFTGTTALAAEDQPASFGFTLQVDGDGGSGVLQATSTS